MFEAYEVAEQSVGIAGRHARRLGAGSRRAGRRRPPEQVKELDYLFYVGSAESFDPRGQKIARAFVAILQRGGRAVRHPRRGRDVDRRMRAPRRQRDAVPAAGERRSSATLNGLGVIAHRHLRPARVQHAEERIPGVRRPLRGDPPHAADRAAARRGAAPRRRRGSSA